MKILIAADKFKGSLTADKVCEAIKDGVLDVDPTVETTLLPLADGGEGTLDILESSLDLKTVKLTVQDPFFRPVQSSYCIKGVDAYVEMARASGFELLHDKERSASKTSSIGTGELIRDAVNRGAKTISLFVGGSATNDGGIGMASALGFRFLDKKGEEVLPVGKNLGAIRMIETGDNPISIKINLITDVSNPLLGPNGASYRYGPQKGAGPAEIRSLEKGLRHLSRLIYDLFGKDISEVPGSGAAGGMGLAVLGLMNGTIQNGIGTILNIVNFDEKLKDTDLVITGEGRIDHQTLQGKVVYGVARTAQLAGVPVMVICGLNELELHELEIIGVADVSGIKNDALTVEYCMENAYKLIRQRTSELVNKNFIN